MNSRIDPSKIRDGGDWELFQVTPEFRRYRLWMNDNSYIMKTEYVQDEELIELNRQEFNDSLTKRFRDDAVGTKVASIPMNKFYSELAPRIKEGDKDHLKWWLNHGENRPFRTFRGKV